MVGSAVASITPISVTLALRIAEIDPVTKNKSYGLAVGTGMVLGLVITPLAGLLSDRTASRRGMRVPWLVSGSLGTIVVALLLAKAATIPGVIVGWLAMTVFISIGFSPLMAIIQDQLPQSQHGVVSGMAGTAPFIGVLLGSWVVQALPQTPFNMFVMPALLGGAMILQFLIFLHDRRQGESEHGGFRAKGLLDGLRMDWRRNSPFLWMLLVIATSWTGMAVMQTYMVYLLQDQVRIDSSRLATAAFQGFMAASTLGAACSLLGGAVSDWLRRRKPVYSAGVCLLAFGLVIQGLSSSMTTFFFGCVAAGVGSGLMGGSTWALAAEASADQATAARDMGLVSVALAIPSCVVPFMAPWIIDIGKGNNYTSLFITCAVITFVGVPLLTLVRTAR
jgi:MFS family permease